MRNVLRRKTVNESTRYDDLLSKSPKTRQALEAPVTSQKKTLFKSKLRKKTSVRVLKVHFRNKEGAASFASLIKQTLRSDNRNIIFVGTYDEKKKQVSVVSKVHEVDWHFTDERTEDTSKPKKRKIWHTDDFYNRHWIDLRPRISLSRG